MGNNSKETGIIHLWDLPEKITYLELNKEYKKKLLETARKLTKGKWNNLARKINIPIPNDNGSTLIRNFRRGSLTSLNLIKKLSKFLIENNKNKFSLDNIERNVSQLSVRKRNSRIINPKFPINFNSKEGAIIISCLYHDGGISVRDLEPFYANTSKKLRRRFLKSVNFLIGEMRVISKKKYDSHEVCCPKILGIILTTIGLIPGKRSINNPELPKFVFRYKNELIYEFLSQAIADDGWVYCPKNKFGFIGFNFTIDLTKYPDDLKEKIKRDKILDYIPNVLLCDKRLFERIGVKVEGPYFKKELKYYKEDILIRYTQEWQINIRDWWSIKLLSKKIKIPLNYKQNRLEKIAKKERNVIRCNPNLLKIIGELKNGFIPRDIIKKGSSLNERTIRYQIKCFCEDKFLKEIRFGYKKRLKFKYFLTNKGKEKLNLLKD